MKGLMELKILDTYRINLGNVVIIENDRDISREDLSKFWVGQEVNGHKVIGVESNAVQVIRKGSKIGLLLSDAGVTI